MSLDAVKQISQKFNIDGIIAQIMVNRGIDTEEKAKRFLSCGIKNLYDPFTLDGVEQAVKKINGYLSKGGSFVIYGDYDADGICSVAILYLYLISKGACVNHYIPEREEGYGINKDAVDFIKHTYNPDIIITVDCGVTAIKEVEYIKSLGIDIIVTDHHNSNGITPDCIVINPKISKDYPFSDLCGAGVALKLVQALGGTFQAEKYIDIAAIATIADSVELKSENRDIVSAGLEKINSGSRIGLKILCDVAGLNKGLNTYSVAFGIVPRINAAGRTGDAKRAVALFSCEDENELNILCKELDRANTQRQKVCDEIISNITKQISADGSLNYRCIIAIDNSCHDGVSGIVASRLCEMYYRPAFVFCPFNGSLKGSGRSIEGVDIFDMLSSMEQLFLRFGGHRLAAGLTIDENNLNEFKDKADIYIKNKYGFSDFIKPKKYDFEITQEIVNEKIIEQLDLFEPCGQGNSRPRFLYRTSGVKALPLKNYPQHIKFRLFDTDITAFNFSDKADILKADAGLFLEFQRSEYNGRMYNKGYLKDAEADAENALQDKIISNFILQYRFSNLELVKAEFYDINNICNVIKDNTELFGTLIVIQSKETVKKLYENCPAIKDIRLSVFFSGDGNNLSKAVLSPDIDFNGQGYNKVIFADMPASGGYISRFTESGCMVFVPENCSSNALKGVKIDLSREAFAKDYKIITDQKLTSKPFTTFSDFYQRAQICFGNINLIQFTACFTVFEELGFFTVNNNEGIIINKGIKKQLESSFIYQKIKYLSEKD